MRRYLAGALFLALALGVAVAGTAIAGPVSKTLPGGGGKVAITQTLNNKQTPNKGSKTKFKRSQLDVTVSAENPDGQDMIPAKADRVIVQFDKKNVKFDLKKGCTANLENTTEQQVRNLCKSGDIISTGKSGAQAQVGSVILDASVLIVNTTKNARADSSATKGTLSLWTRIDDANLTTVLPSTLKKNKLNVTVPPLAGGAGAITLFRGPIVSRGKNRVLGRCKAKQSKTKGTFNFVDQDTINLTHKQKCKQK